MALYIGLDVGTQGTKCLCYDEDKGVVVSRSGVTYGVTQTRPGQAEQHPETWVEACKEALAAALQDVDATQVRTFPGGGVC